MEYGITLNKIVDDILNDAYGGIPSDGYSKEQVRYKIFRWRELILRRDVERNDVDPLFMQSIVVEFELTGSTVACGTSDCKVLRSTVKIPQLVRPKNSHIWTLESYLDDLSEVPGDSLYTPVYSYDRRWLPYRRMTGAMKYAYIDTDKYLYVFNTKEPRYGLMRGIFFDPREAAIFSDCDGYPCYTDDDPFPLSGDIGNVIYEAVLKEVKQAIIYDTSPQNTAEEKVADRVEH